MIIVAGAALAPFFDDLLDVLSLEAALVTPPIEGVTTAGCQDEPDFSALDQVWSALLHAPVMARDDYHLKPQESELAVWSNHVADVRASTAGSAARPREVFSATCDRLALTLMETESYLLDGDVFETSDESEAQRDAVGTLLTSAIAVRWRIYIAAHLPDCWKYIGCPSGRFTALVDALTEAHLGFLPLP